MGVLIVAPLLTGLPALPSEAQECTNLLSRAGHTVQLLQEPVTLLELQRAIDRGPYGLLILGAHSGAEGWLLSQGQLWNPEDLGRFCDSIQCTGAILNSCFSAQHVRVVQDYARRTEIIATIQPAGIADDAAWAGGLYLVRAFLRSGSLSAAARTAGGQYRWFPAWEPLGANGVMDVQQGEVPEIKRQVESILRALNGEFRRPGLIDELVALRSKLDQAIDADSEWKRQAELQIKELVSLSHKHANSEPLTPRAFAAIILIGVAFVALVLSLTWLLAR